MIRNFIWCIFNTILYLFLFYEKISYLKIRTIVDGSVLAVGWRRLFRHKRFLWPIFILWKSAVDKDWTLREWTLNFTLEPSRTYRVSTSSVSTAVAVVTFCLVLRRWWRRRAGRGGWRYVRVQRLTTTQAWLFAYWFFVVTVTIATASRYVLQIQIRFVINKREIKVFFFFIFYYDKIVRVAWLSLYLKTTIHYCYFFIYLLKLIEKKNFRNVYC